MLTISGVAEFQSTIWTVIRRAKERDETSVAEFVRRYRAPVLSYIRRRGFAEADAEDVTQEVFLKLVKDDVLSKVERQKGRFRDLLLAVTRNTMNEFLRRQMAQKRGSGTVVRSLDEPLGRDTDEVVLKDTIPDEDRREFDAVWVESLVSRAFERLRDECAQEKTLYYEVLASFVGKDSSYEELAARFNLKTSDVRNYLHYGRLKLKRHIRALVKDHSLSPDDYETELKMFADVLGDEH